MSIRRRARVGLGRVLRALLHPLLGPCLRLAADRPSIGTMRLLKVMWGNRLGAAPADYLATLARSLRTIRPRAVLECGSGLTTLLLGTIAEHGGFRVLSLEDDAGWAARVRREAARLRLASVEVVHAPLERCDDYRWYSPAARSGRLPARVEVVVCDGPLGTTLGGRYGLLPELREHLDGAFVFLDDANRAGEQDVLERWRNEFGVEVTMRPDYLRGLAVVRVPATVPPSSS